MINRVQADFPSLEDLESLKSSKSKNPANLDSDKIITTKNKSKK